MLFLCYPKCSTRQKARVFPDAKGVSSVMRQRHTGWEAKVK